MAINMLSTPLHYVIKISETFGWSVVFSRLADFLLFKTIDVHNIVEISVLIKNVDIKLCVHIMIKVYIEILVCAGLERELVEFTILHCYVVSFVLHEKKSSLTPITSS